MTITVTLGNRPVLDAEERRQRYLRAKESVNNLGWVFDELIGGLTADLLSTDPDDTTKRESIFHQINGAAQAKGLLLGIIQQQEFEEAKHERKHRNEPPANHD